MLVYCHSMQCKIIENMIDSLGYRKFYRDNILKKIQKKLRLKSFFRSFTPVGLEMSNPNTERG